MGAELVVIGTSWGGLNALSTLLEGLPPDYEVPLVVVQHRGRGPESLLCVLLQEHTTLRVVEVNDKQSIDPGFVYLAPPDYHLLVDAGHFSLTVDAPVRYSRPSIDVTFMSVADMFADAAVGIVLTGANEDGAAGLKRIADRGGRAIVQDPASAEIPTMPLAALRVVPTARVMALTEIGPHLGELSRERAALRAGRRP